MQTLMVLKELLDDPAGQHYGLRLAEQTGIPPGTIYPILTRFAEAGWLTRQWEEIDPSEQGRPPRAYYELTGDGETAAREAFAKATSRGRGAFGRLLGGEQPT